MGTLDGTPADAARDRYDARFDAITDVFVASCLSAREQYSKRLLEIDDVKNKADQALFDTVENAEVAPWETMCLTAQLIAINQAYTNESVTAAKQFKIDVQAAADQAAKSALGVL